MKHVLDEKWAWQYARAAGWFNQMKGPPEKAAMPKNPTKPKKRR
jgi:hypothetical protein